MYKYLIKNSIKNLRRISIQIFCTTLVISVGFIIFTTVNFTRLNFLNNFNKVQETCQLHQLSFFNADRTSRDINKQDADISSVYSKFSYDPDNPEIQKILRDHPGIDLSTPKGVYQCSYYFEDILAKKHNFYLDQDKTITQFQVVDGKSRANIATTFLNNKNNINNIATSLDTPFYQGKGNGDIIINENDIKDGEVIINKEWAKGHHKSVGDTIFAFGQNYKVVAYGINPYFLTTDNDDFLRDKSTNLFCIFNRSDYANISISKNYLERYRTVARFNENNLSTKELHKLVMQVTNEMVGTAIHKKDIADSINLRSLLISETWSGSDPNYSEDKIFTTFFKLKINSNIAILFLLFITIYSLIILYIISKRQINNQSNIIGVLKSLGYRTKEIVFSMCMPNLISVILGVTLGTIVGFLCQMILYNNLGLTYPGSSLYFSFPILFMVIFFAIFIIFMPSLFFLYIFCKKNAQQIIVKEEDNKPTIISKAFSYSSRKLPFAIRFPIINISKSLGKTFLVMATINISAVFTLFSLSASMTMNNFIHGNETGSNYNYGYHFINNIKIGAGISSIYKTYDVRKTQPIQLGWNDLKSDIENTIITHQDPAQFRQQVDQKYLQLGEDQINDFMSFIKANREKIITFDNNKGLSLYNNFYNYATQIKLNTIKTGIPAKLLFGFNEYDSNNEMAFYSLGLGINWWHFNLLYDSQLNIDEFIKIHQYLPNISLEKLEILKNAPKPVKPTDPLAVIMPSIMANMFKYKVGQTIHFPIEEGIQTNLKIVAIYNDNFNTSIFGRFNGMKTILPLLPDNDSRTYIYSKADRFSYLESLYSIRMDTFENILKDAYSTKEQINVLTENMYTANKLIIIFIWLSTIWNAIILILISSLIIQEYGYFISIMKILGYSTKKICNLFLKMYMILILIGFIIAIPIEYALVNKINNLQKSIMPISFHFVVEVWQIIAIFATIIILTLVAYLFSLSWIKKINYLKLSNSTN